VTHSPYAEPVLEHRGRGGIIAEGIARVVLDVDGLEGGEILVARWRSPSWTPVFGKNAAAVVDVGG
jgi:phosphoenolpyruvate synthase/pyruvate phosphate dikinase